MREGRVGGIRHIIHTAHTHDYFIKFNYTFTLALPSSSVGFLLLLSLWHFCRCDKHAIFFLLVWGISLLLSRFCLFTLREKYAMNF